MGNYSSRWITFPLSTFDTILRSIESSFNHRITWDGYCALPKIYRQSRSNFQDLQKNQKIRIEILGRNSRTLEYDRREDPWISPRIFLRESCATNDRFYYPLASAKFSLALCRGNALSGIRTALSYTRCFPMREILYATSENVMKTGRNTAKLVIISGMDPPPRTISLLLPVHRYESRTS